jgi:hypothetical protein
MQIRAIANQYLDSLKLNNDVYQNNPWHVRQMARQLHDDLLINPSIGQTSTRYMVFAPFIWFISYFVSFIHPDPEKIDDFMKTSTELDEKLSEDEKKIIQTYFFHYFESAPKIRPISDNF